MAYSLGVTLTHNCRPVLMGSILAVAVDPRNRQPRDDIETLQGAVDREAHARADVSTELAAQTKKLAESDALFRLLVESVKDYAIYMLDPSGRIATWNTGAERLKGYSADEAIGRHFSMFFPDIDKQGDKWERELDAARITGTYEEEGWRVRKDGTQFWANIVITAVYNEGQLVGFAKVTRDLTERLRAEQERHAAEERRHADEQKLKLLIDSVRDYAIFLLDPTGHIATWNPGAQRFKGYSAEEIIGRHFAVFYPVDDVRAGKCDMELEVAARDGRFEDEGWRIRKDGSRFWANVVITALRDASGKLVGFGKVTRDLTDRRRAEDERARRVAAEEANRTKDHFLAMLGHELRNPLAPIASALQLMRLRGDDRSLREVQIIERQVKQMNRLVDDLLDVSRISRGRLELQRHDLDVRDVLAKAAEIAIPLFEKKGQRFDVNAPAYPLVTHADETRLIQVFANILSNAGKYTHEGGCITVSVSQVDKVITVEVRDNGKGIAPELLPRVFDLFVQAHQNVDRPEGGLGLGLTLVRALTEAHGGSVHARSHGPGHGSTFTIQLPAAHDIRRPGTAEMDPAFAPASGRRRILLVDDNEDARLLLADILTRMGHEVRTAPDGPAALAILDEFDAEAAVLDIGLPGMDGHELARRIRATKRCSIRLLALTGYGGVPDKERSRAAGFDAHLVKPVDINKLLSHIDAKIQGDSAPA